MIEFLNVRDTLQERTSKCQLSDQALLENTYYKLVRYEFVEIDAASNAGQVVDPASEIQSCPCVPMINAADAATKAVLLMSGRAQALEVGPCDVPRIILPRTFMLRLCLFQRFQQDDRGNQSLARIQADVVFRSFQAGRGAVTR